MLFRTRSAAPIEAVIAGLGNPGTKYAGTRHNAGFIALEALAEDAGVKLTRVKFRSLTAEAEIGGRRTLLLQPQTFMNNSGEAVRDAMRFYKLVPEQVLVMFDDITLPPGQLRIRRKGSDGGQKGMASILYHCGTDTFPRIRLGVGAKPHPEYDLAAWVLSRFTKEELPLIREAAANAVGAAKLIIAGDIEKAMSTYSR